MNTRHTHRSTIALLGAGCLVALLSSGCAYSFSSLATDTGPRTHGGEWSVAKSQWVHVGERLDVSFALQSKIADYAVLTVEPLGQARVNLVAERGRFVFEDLRFTEPTPPDRPLVLRAAAYRERNERDVMDLEGRLLRRESPFDVADQKVAGATLSLHVYQSNLAIQVPPDSAGYNWQTAKLLLYVEPERPVEIRPAREYRSGFRVDGPTAGGAFVVAYEPTGEQVRRTDSTRVVFTVLTAAGKEHRQEIWLPTP